MSNLPARPDKPERPPSLAATVVVGGLAAFGAITLVQWLFASVIGLIRFGIAVVIVLAVLAWVVGRRAER